MTSQSKPFLNSVSFVQCLRKLALVCVLITLNTSSAAPICTAVAGAVTLPDEALELIRNHPISKLKEDFHDGESLNFTSYEFGNYSADSNPTGVFGESIQAQFVRSTLQVIFPKAKFSSPHEKPEQKQGVRIYITDSAEDYEDGVADYVQSPGALEMSVLKQANPGRLNLNSTQLRRDWGFSSRETVVSIYASQWNFKYLPEVIQKLKQLMPKPLTIIISGGGSSIKKDNLTLKQNSDLFQDFLASIKNTETEHLSSHLRFQNPTQDFRVLLNDTFGKMPEIYTLSNLAVVLGPINILEPISQGTPSVYSNNRTIRGSYPYFSDMSQVDITTGYGFPFDSMSEFEKQVSAALARHKTPLNTPPYLVKRPGQKNSQFEKYLDHLESYLLNEFRISKATNSGTSQ